jgi:hypothetical protein
MIHGEIDPGIEPERYELVAGPAYHFDLERRDFFKALGGGILIVFISRRKVRSRPIQEKSRSARIFGPLSPRSSQKNCVSR